jgi:hypothetical protein
VDGSKQAGWRPWADFDLKSGNMTKVMEETLIRGYIAA